MKRIAFIVHRFGKEVNGGAEVHVRMLAERLIPFYNIDVLTTTIQDWNDRSLDYQAGVSSCEGIKIIRFNTINFNQSLFSQLEKKAKWGRKIRYTLFQINLLKVVSGLFARVNVFKNKERQYFEQEAAFSPDLLSYINEKKDEYDVFIFMTYYFSNTLLGGLIAPEKTILIPTAHKEKKLFFNLYGELFSKVKHIAFNTAAERQLCERIFGNLLAPNSIVATGIELKPSQNWNSVQEKFGLPDKYILYLGRVTYGKINSLLEDFVNFKRKDNSNVKLVLTGGIDDNIPTALSPDILFTGFVTEEEKSAIVEHATLMVNPSKYESLSLLLLEGLFKGIPVLVNGKSHVLKEHCILSNGACYYYSSKKDFNSKLTMILASDSLRVKMGVAGKEYVTTNYSWEIILTRLRKLIDE